MERCNSQNISSKLNKRDNSCLLTRRTMSRLKRFKIKLDRFSSGKLNKTGFEEDKFTIKTRSPGF